MNSTTAQDLKKLGEELLDAARKQLQDTGDIIPLILLGDPDDAPSFSHRKPV
jgi:hypothetical protein